jgi:endonuclease III
MVKASDRQRSRVRRIARFLDEEHGSPRHGNPSDPLDDLVHIVLSQATTEKSQARVFTELKLRHPDLTQLADLSLRSIRQLIKDAGLSRQRAPRLKAMLRQIRREFGEVTLEPLRTWSDRAVLSFLTALPGVGVKTAKCVMMYALDRCVLPVDTHVGRVSRRLGLIGPSVSMAALHGELEAVVPPSLRYGLHVNLVAHGRAYCRVRAPKCESCGLRRICPRVGVGEGHPRARR